MQKKKDVSPELRRAANIAMKELLGLREGEEVLMTHPEKMMPDMTERLVNNAIVACPDVLIYLSSKMKGQDP